MFLQPTRTSPCLPIATLSSSRTFLMNAQKKKFKKFSSIFQFFTVYFVLEFMVLLLLFVFPDGLKQVAQRALPTLLTREKILSFRQWRNQVQSQYVDFQLFLMYCRWITVPFLSISRLENPRPASETRMESIGTNPMRKRRRIPNDLHWRPKPTRRFTYKASLRIVLCFVVSYFLFL